MSSLVCSSVTRIITSPVLNYSRRIIAYSTKSIQMDHQSSIGDKKHANFRLCNVSGYVTDVLEIQAEEPTLHILFVPGNPGVISFYSDFLESLFEMMGKSASITAIGHISHTKENREHGKLFSLEDQIDHKMHFMENELQNIDVPLILVGHSIGSYICIEMFKRSPRKVIYCFGLYPFLTVNTKSSVQSLIKEVSRSPFLCAMLSSIVAFLGFLPNRAARFLVKKSIGKSWSCSAVDSLCTDVLKYHTVRNMLFMAMTEFEKLVEKPDWDFMKENKSKIAFLFGIDDHWAPLQMFEMDEIYDLLTQSLTKGLTDIEFKTLGTHWKLFSANFKSPDKMTWKIICRVGYFSGHISEKVPDIAIEVEREGHTHAFSCTIAGSQWAARHVSTTLLDGLTTT